MREPASDRGAEALYTIETALEALGKYDIREYDLQTWEKALSLEIPVDEYGRKSYSPHHVNLFKNIKKHIALGRTIDEIRQIISLPPLESSRPQAVGAASRTSPPVAPQKPQPPAIREEAGQAITEAEPPARSKSLYASTPKRAFASGSGDSGASGVINLVQRLNQEKDQLYKKLLETEKLNSHLYSANSLFHRKVREMTLQMNQMRENFNEHEKFKLMDDKARLHKQLIEVEKLNQYKQEEILHQKLQNENLRQQLKRLEERIAVLTAPFDAGRFCGDWMENGVLVEVAYDNFGINIEPERMRLFRISEPPTRLYGAMAVIGTSYQYETNNLWKRDETLLVSCTDEEMLEGELIAEYILDGVPVAKAIYRVTCRISR